MKEITKEEFESFAQREFPNKATCYSDGYCFIQDECNEPYLHVHNGIRKSLGSKMEDGINIHFFGPCITYGFMMPDEETIPSLVYQHALENGKTISGQRRL